MNPKRMVAAALIGSVLLSIAGCGDGGKSPESRAEAFIRATTSGDMSKVRSFMTPEERKRHDALPKEQRDAMDKLMSEVMKASAEEVKGKGGIKSVKTGEAKIDGDKATVDVEVTLGNGDTQKGKVDLVLVDGVWYSRD